VLEDRAEEQAAGIAARARIDSALRMLTVRNMRASPVLLTSG
jgi:hypothetical protein